ncbi:glutathione-dependent formaldehyde-activating, GFA [Eremomyces bilateralis CBS 781.70]|uniref:Glutathione-dependent formaldehyde-activating, GFA n=1 Tax=Eremomyces bilateralis CBS 781.70 TaxID=1392243 RepID=A0A6G1G9I5_9PEZI|nr:glutathione-dependent formaldehyde-activating, GFA [Eremomyces bilateralis CBS 781.70]KAF1814570.1 glutathione-dependent formaldehyde-activating, GFA [Eremomyces bilateralis CBS 781.70]
MTPAGENPNYPLLGGCGCGRIRYAIEVEPLTVHCCHCTFCMRETGSSYAVNILKAPAALATATTSETIEPIPMLIPSFSGLGQTIFRCPNCYVAVWSHYAGADSLVSFIRAGTLDRKDVIVPELHIYTSTKQPWVILPDGAQAFEEFYDWRKVWKAESREWFEAVLKSRASEMQMKQ